MADGGIVYIEIGFSEVVRSEFAGMGHQIDLISVWGLFGGCKWIRQDPATGVYTGASECRKDGQALGY